MRVCQYIIKYIKRMLDAGYTFTRRLPINLRFLPHVLDLTPPALGFQPP
jgi:hypothetical protein